MNLLIDTDVLLDVALGRQEFLADSAFVLQWAQEHPGKAAVAWHTLSNIAYLVRPDARGFLRDLLQFVEVAPVGTADAVRALGMKMADIEDCLQVSSALSFGANRIITRNLPHYRSSPIPAQSPSAFRKDRASRSG